MVLHVKPVWHETHLAARRRVFGFRRSNRSDSFIVGLQIGSVEYFSVKKYQLNRVHEYDKAKSALTFDALWFENTTIKKVFSSIMVL